MHYYSIDTAIRRYIYIGIALVSYVIPKLLEKYLVGFLGLPEFLIKPISFGLLYSLLFWLFDIYIWKWKLVRHIIKIPDLNAKWSGVGTSSYIDPTTNAAKTYDIVVIIKQTMTRLNIYAVTDKSTSSSTMAHIDTEKTIPLIKYAYNNIPENIKADNDMFSHAGYMEFRIENENYLYGNYFNNRDRVTHGNIELRRDNGY